MAKSRTITTQPIPLIYLDKIEALQESLGCYTRVDCMGKILEHYFGKPEGSMIVEEPAPDKKEDGGIW